MPSTHGIRLRCLIKVSKSGRADDRAVRTRNYWGDPNRIKAKAFDIVELRFQALECAATVLPEVAACCAASVATAPGNSVREHEVYATRLPRRSISCMDQGSDMQQCSDNGFEEQHLNKIYLNKNISKIKSSRPADNSV